MYIYDKYLLILEPMQHNVTTTSSILRFVTTDFAIPDSIGRNEGAAINAHCNRITEPRPLHVSVSS